MKRGESKSSRSQSGYRSGSFKRRNIHTSAQKRQGGTNITSSGSCRTESVLPTAKDSTIGNEASRKIFSGKEKTTKTLLSTEQSLPTTYEFNERELAVSNPIAAEIEIVEPPPPPLKRYYGRKREQEKHSTSSESETADETEKKVEGIEETEEELNDTILLKGKEKDKCQPETGMDLKGSA